MDITVDIARMIGWFILIVLCFFGGPGLMAFLLSLGELSNGEGRRRNQIQSRHAYDVDDTDRV